MSAEGGSLRESAYRGVAATVVQQGYRLTMQMVSLIVLARLLSPDDFGVYAMVLPISAIVNLFQDLGLQDAIIQRRDVKREQVNKLYWINVALSVAIAVALVAAAPLVGVLYKDPRTAALTAALALPTLIGGLAYQQYAMLARELRFVTLAVIDIACVSAGFAVAVIGALVWDSYWALWASGVVSSLLWTVAATSASSWRPSWPSFKADTDGMLKFGAHLTGVSILTFLTENLDKVLIGRFWGSVALGFYDRAYKLLLFPIQHVSRPFGRLAIPLLTRLRDEPERFRGVYLRIVGQINLIAIPAVVAALVTHGELIEFLLGPEWAPAAVLFAWLGIAAIHQPTTAAINWLLIVQGRTSEMLRYGVLTGIVTVIAFVVGLPHGALGVARAYAIADCLIRLPVMVYLAGRSGPVKSLDFVGVLAPFVLAAGATWLVALGLMAAGISGFALLAVMGTVSYGFAAAAMLAFPSGRATLREARTLAEKALRTVLGRAFGSRGAPAA